MPLQLPVTSWRVYYGLQGEEVGIGDVLPVSAPREGVQVIVYFHPDGYKTVAHGQDAYLWCEESDGEVLTSGLALSDADWGTLIALALISTPPVGM